MTSERSQSNEICHANIFERIEFRNIFWWIYAWYDVRCVNWMRLVNAQMLFVCLCCFCNFCSLCEQLNGSAEEIKRIAEKRAIHGTSISIFQAKSLDTSECQPGVFISKLQFAYWNITSQWALSAMILLCLLAIWRIRVWQMSVNFHNVFIFELVWHLEWMLSTNPNGHSELLVEIGKEKGAGFWVQIETLRLHSTFVQRIENIHECDRLSEFWPFSPAI